MSEEQITMNKPEKNARRVEAGKKLAEYNNAMRKKKVSGEPSNFEESLESNRENVVEEGISSTGIMVIVGLA